QWGQGGVSRDGGNEERRRVPVGDGAKPLGCAGALRIGRRACRATGRTLRLLPAAPLALAHLPGVRLPSTRAPAAPVASGTLPGSPLRCAQARAAKASASLASGSTPSPVPSCTGTGAS